MASSAGNRNGSPRRVALPSFSWPTELSGIRGSCGDWRNCRPIYGSSRATCLLGRGTIQPPTDKKQNAPPTFHCCRGQRQRGPHHVLLFVSETGRNGFWQEVRLGVRRKGREPGRGCATVRSQRGHCGKSRQRPFWPRDHQEFPIAGN